MPTIGPNLQHWFGVEPHTGRDLFSVVVTGGQVSLTVGLFATILALLIGVVVGVTAGFVGGPTDTVLSKLTDIILLFPGLIFMIALSAVVPEWFNRVLLMILIIGLFGWASIARVVRAQTLQLRQFEYVKFARLVGAKRLHIIFKHLLPNLAPTIIIFGAISIPAKIGAEATLSFLGVGITPPTPTWGRAIADAVNWINVDPLYLLFPGLFLFLITLSLNIFGDCLRDVIDPNLQGDIRR